MSSISEPVKIHPKVYEGMRGVNNALPRRSAGERRPISRRADLLSATRSRLATEGHERVTLRMIAADCETTVQTVHNLIGNRKQVLGAVLIDHGQKLRQLVQECDDYPLLIFAFVDLMWHSALIQPEFLRQATFIYAALDVDSYRPVQTAGLQFVRSALADLRGRLRKGMSINALAEAMQSMIATALHDWAQGKIDLPELRKSLRVRAAMLVLGAAKPDECKVIETWLSMESKLSMESNLNDLNDE